MHRVYLTLLWIGLAFGQLVIDTTGQQILRPIFNRPVLLPNNTMLVNDSVPVNILATMGQLLDATLRLQDQITTLQARVQTLESTPPPPVGCWWSGVYCDCTISRLQINIAILTGSQCINSTIQWVRTLDVLVASTINSSVNCTTVLNTSQCNGFF